MILGERNKMSNDSIVRPKRKYTKKKKSSKSNLNICHIDFLKQNFTKKEGESVAHYIHLWNNNYRINFYSVKDIRSYFVQIKKSKKGLSYVVL